jgi:hypothetical protein
VTGALRLTAAERELIERTRIEQAAQETTQAERELALLRRAREGNSSARDAILKTVTSALDLAVPLVGVVKVTSDPPEFHLLLDGDPPTRLHLGGVEVLDGQTLFGRAFLLALGWKPCKVKPRDWDRIVTSLASCAQDERPDEALTDAGRGARWIRRYLAGLDTAPVDLTDSKSDDDRRNEARMVDRYSRPFSDEKGLHVYLDAVQRHIRESSHGGENPTPREVSRCLKAAKCVRKPTKFPKPIADGETTRSTWIVPDDLDG